MVDKIATPPPEVQPLDLTQELKAHWAKDKSSKWRPGMGIWMGNVEQRFHVLGMRADLMLRRMKDVESRTAMLEIKDLEDRVAKLEKHLQLQERLEDCIAKLEARVPPAPPKPIKPMPKKQKLEPKEEPTND